MATWKIASVMPRAAAILALLPFVGCGGGDLALPIVFVQPPVVFFTPGGGERPTLTSAITTAFVGGMSVTGPTYNSRPIGPTYRMRPGATAFHLDLVNDMPANPEVERDGAFPHDRYTTNLHTHGLTVSPSGISDNVFRHMEPGTTSEVLVTVRPDQPSGTFWYHPHKHGAATYQFMGGQAGFLIVEGGPGSLDDLPEIKAARDLVMGFQTIRTNTRGTVPWVNPSATNFMELWSTLQDGNLLMTTNGVVAPTLHMQPGEVVRWRMLNATVGETLALRIVRTDTQRLLGMPMHLIAQDGLTMADMMTLPFFGAPYIMGAGNRADVLIKAPLSGGSYELRTYNTSPDEGLGETAAIASISPQGIEPAGRFTRVFPSTAPHWQYPITLVNIEVAGDVDDMPLPAGPLPQPPAIDAAARSALLLPTPSKTRNVLFEICNAGTIDEGSCGAFGIIFDYNTPGYWGGTDFNNWLLMRDDDDFGPGFGKQALFTGGQPLFSDMFAGAIEEWTIKNVTNTDHPFHIHINPFLLTHINGVPLPVPEWRDTVLVPAKASGLPVGSVTFRTHFHPDITGRFVAHCHILSHEDVGMMQELEIKPSLPR